MINRVDKLYTKRLFRHNMLTPVIKEGEVTPSAPLLFLSVRQHPSSFPPLISPPTDHLFFSFSVLPKTQLFLLSQSHICLLTALSFSLFSLLSPRGRPHPIRLCVVSTQWPAPTWQSWTQQRGLHWTHVWHSGFFCVCKKWTFIITSPLLNQIEDM